MGYDINGMESNKRRKAARKLDRIAIISDIHGNVPALEAVLLDIEQRGVKHIVCLGDLVGKGPEPDKVIDRIREVCEVVVQGNWDLGITYRQDQVSGLWQQTKIGTERLAYLEQLPLAYEFLLSGRLFRLFHASATSVFHRVKRKASKEERLALFKNTELTNPTCGQRRPDIVGYADIHVPYLITLKTPSDEPDELQLGSGLTLFNVGSVGSPYDGIPHSCYSIVEGFWNSGNPSAYSIQIVRVPYDIERSIHLAQAANMPESERYISEIRTGLVHK
jgi:protein phosphatase